MASDEKGISAGEDVEKRKPLFTVVGRSGGGGGGWQCVNWYYHCGKQYYK